MPSSTSSPDCGARAHRNERNDQMDNPQQYVDEATFKWTVGGVVALCFGAMGVIWKRLNGLEEKGGQRDDANVKAAKEADDTLWEAVMVAKWLQQRWSERTTHIGIAIIILVIALVIDGTLPDWHRAVLPVEIG